MNSVKYDKRNVLTYSFCRITLVQIKEKIRYSVRHPHNMWVVRVALLLAMVFVLDFGKPGLKIKSTKPDVWASTWVSENGLDLIYTEQSVGTNVKTKELANNEQNLNTLSSSNIDVVSDKSTSTRTRTSVYNKPLERVHSPITSLSLKSNPVPLITISPVEQNLEIATNYPYYSDIQLTDDTEVKGEEYYVPKSPKIKMFVGGVAGLSFLEDVIMEPNGTSYARASNIENLTVQDQSAQQLHNIQGVGANFEMGIRVGKHVEFQTGANFSQYKGTHSLYFDSKVNKTQTITTAVNVEGEGRNMEVIETEVSYNNYFSDTLTSEFKTVNIEIPLIVKYNFGNQKLNYFVSSGASAMISNSYSSNFESNEIGSGELNELNNGFSSINLLFGVGVQYQVSPNIVFKLTPGYKYRIPVSGASVYQSNSSVYGIFTGINYYFN